MPLQFLEFDLSEDSAGGFSASTLACPAAQHTPALLAEVQALLQALSAELDTPGAIEDSHGWDLALQIETADGQLLAFEVQAFEALLLAPPSERISLSLHLAGGEALRHILSAWTDA